MEIFTRLCRLNSNVWWICSFHVIFVVCQVLEVEEEMRELLKETDASKRAMEQRFRKLTSAFSELQQDL